MSQEMQRFNKEADEDLQKEDQVMQDPEFRKAEAREKQQQQQQSQSEQQTQGM